MKKRIAWSVFGAFGALVLYLLAWPVDLDPAGFTAPSPPPMTGAYAPNDELGRARVVANDLSGPESVAFDAEGLLYTGVSDGRILRIDPDRRRVSTYARTGGRPLGLAFGPDGALAVADAERGLLSVTPNGSVRVLADRAGGEPIRFANHVAVASNGTIYFTDASIHPLAEGPLVEVLESRPHGRLLAYRPELRRAEVLFDRLYFANGVAISRDESFLIVAETMAYRIRRFRIRGGAVGRPETFAENLPGFPDNLSRDEDGNFWVAFASTRVAAVERLQSSPFLSRVVRRIPRAVFPSPKPVRYGLVLGFDAGGTVVRNLQDPEGDAVAQVTSAVRHGSSLYLGSLAGRSIQKLAL